MLSSPLFLNLVTAVAAQLSAPLRYDALGAIITYQGSILTARVGAGHTLTVEGTGRQFTRSLNITNAQFSALVDEIVVFIQLETLLDDVGVVENVEELPVFEDIDFGFAY